MINKTFRWKVSVRGELIASYVFQDLQEVDSWLNFELQNLNKQYDTDLEYKITTLDELKVGDTCHVDGEAQDIFKIIELLRYSPHRYGFILDSGVVEEVAKCYKTK